MKRVATFLMAFLVCFITAACGNGEEHIGEAKTPSGSSVMKGRDYESVAESFEKNGFTNIQFEKIEDLVTGWITEDGEVQKVTVGGDEDYSADEWIPADTEVIIYYHTFANGGSDTEDHDDANGSSNQVSDDEAQTAISGTIQMVKSSAEYIGSEWTIDELTEHFADMGFTNIKTVACEPDDDTYKINIRELYIKTGMFSTDPWEAGEQYKSDAEISIYYNEFPLLNIENCSDLVAILNGAEMDYMSFSNQYDGHYVEFDAYVCGHIVYDGGTSHIIDVTGKRSSSGEENGMKIRIGDRTFDNSIDESVEEGDYVTVSGRIDASWSEFYKQLYVETLVLSKK